MHDFFIPVAKPQGQFMTWQLNLKIEGTYTTLGEALGVGDVKGAGGSSKGAEKSGGRLHLCNLKETQAA